MSASASFSSWIKGKFWDDSGTERQVSGGKSKLHLQSDFIRGSKKSTESFLPGGPWSRFRYRLRRLGGSAWLTQSMALVVLFDAYCNIQDIDARAVGQRASELFQAGSIICLFLYTAEMLLMMIGQGLVFLKDVMFVVDLGVIIGGYVEVVLSLANPNLAERMWLLSAIRLLRLGRVFRLLRLFKRMRALRELQKLVLMASTCLKTLIWSFVFCFVVMTIWAMLLVEIVNPLIQDLHSKDPEIFDGCEHCIRATTSVMNANLLLFKTVIAGDSWGLVAVPVIEAYPATATIFVGSLLTLVFGVLNLIVAVVVDTFADARDRDILNLAEEMEHDLEADKMYLERMFNRIDLEGSGQLSLEQLVEGARKDHEFQSRLRVMDIDEADLVQLFDMIDTDGSGFIEPNEFIKPLSRWVHDSKTAPRFIKYNMLRIMHEQTQIQEFQADLRKTMEKNFADLAKRIALVRSPANSVSLERGEIHHDSDSVDGVTEALESVPTSPGWMESNEGALGEAEMPERLRPSRPVALQLNDAEAEVQAAMGRLEELLKHATEAAWRESTAMIKQTMLDMRKLDFQADVFPAPSTASKMRAGAEPLEPGADLMTSGSTRDTERTEGLQTAVSRSAGSVIRSV